MLDFWPKATTIAKGTAKFFTILQRSKLESVFSNVLHLRVLTVFCFTNLRPREDNVRAQIKTRRAKLTSFEDNWNSYSFMNDYVFSGWKTFYWLSFVLCICKSVRNIRIYTNLLNLSLFIGRNMNDFSLPSSIDPYLDLQRRGF